MWHHMINFTVVEGLRGKRHFGSVVLNQSVCLSFCLLCSNALYYALPPMILRRKLNGEVSETTSMFHRNWCVQKGTICFVLVISTHRLYWRWIWREWLNWYWICSHRFGILGCDLVYFGIDWYWRLARTDGRRLKELRKWRQHIPQKL